VHGKDVTHHARSYLSGLLGTQRRKNIERIGEDVQASNYQGMQQMVSDSPWSHDLLMEQVAGEINGLLGGHRHSALYLDETSFVKKGDASVGVKRQYCGRLGKIDNCQVGVFAALGRADRVALADFRLYLPQEWVDSPERCKKAKVPPEQQVARTKTELALEMIKAARARGLNYQWIGGDEVYGNNRNLTYTLEAMGEVFLMDIAKTYTLYWDNPEPRPKPQRSDRRGRPVNRNEATIQASKGAVSKLVEEEFETRSRWTDIRASVKGKLRSRTMVRECWEWDGHSSEARRRLLIAREETDGTYKYSLSNAASDTTWKELAYMQAQRFWIERSFQDAKSELGMAQYEVRGWRGWHHHISLVCLAMLFVLKERLFAAEEAPLLSARDVVELLNHYLPRRDRSEADVMESLRRRHEERARDIARRHNQRAVF